MDNLLEMCRKLFPEYNEIEFNDNGNLEFSKDNVCELEISWFEFCIISLNNELNDIFFNSDMLSEKYDYFVEDILLLDEDIHIIDYLYSEFNKLK